MPMRRPTRQQLAKALELVEHLLPGQACHFCREAVAPAFPRITLHHVNEDRTQACKAQGCQHEKALAHASCHRAYHMRQEWKYGVLSKARSSRANEALPRC